MPNSGGPQEDPETRIRDLTFLAGEQAMTIRQLIAALQERDQVIAAAKTEIAEIRAELSRFVAQVAAAEASAAKVPEGPIA